MSVHAIGVIPARWGSTRFPGKPLALIGGKPLLQWVIEGSSSSRKIQELLVATDDERIAALARSCGVQAVMTDSDLPTGTDRIFQATQKINCDVVVNIQGDEPLIEGEILDQLITPFENQNNLEMATLGSSLNIEGLQSANTVKIVVNERSEAIYFSRFPIPYSRVSADQAVSAGDDNNQALTGALKHIGIYAYRKNFLDRFCSQKPTPLEQLESLEQLRALYLGARIKVVKVKHESWGVDTPDDVKKIETILKARNS